MSMILALNAGSSSLRYTLFSGALEVLEQGHFDAIGKKGSAKHHANALKQMLETLEKKHPLSSIKKVAHRVVHGGELFKKTTLLNPLNLKKLATLSTFAPLHNPIQLDCILSCQKLLPKARHYAVFDTAFHAHLPEKAYLYGLPYSFYTKAGIRRYGFHGISHEYVTTEALKILKKKHGSFISCHIGNGVSLAAVKNGICLDTTMGFTPLEGPMMGTRSGSIDPAIIFHLAKKSTLAKIEELLQKESGFKGMSEMSSDIRDLWAKPKAPGTLRTFELFSYQMAKLILGLMAALQEPPDALIFTAGIGENAFYLRKQITDYLKPFGFKLDATKNRANALIISHPDSSFTALVLPTNEALQMARSI